MVVEINPIVVKEVRSRMRGGRAFLMLTGFLLGLGAVAYGLYLFSTRNERLGVTILSSQVGQTLFAGLSFMLLGLICVIAPAVTAGAISGERERLTYEMLVATPLRPWRLLVGKLIATLSYVFLLLLAAVPLGSIVFIFGGITVRDVLKVLVVVIMTGITTGTLGLFASSLLRRTGRAAAFSYLVIAVTTLGLLFSATLWQVRKGTAVPLALLAPNPVSATASAIATFTTPNGPNNVVAFEKIAPPMVDPFFPGGAQFGGTLDLPGWRILSIGVWKDPNAGNPFPAAPAVPELRPVWRDTLVVQGLASLVMFWLALHFVRPRRVWRLGVEDLVMTVVVLLSATAAALWRGWV